MNRRISKVATVLSGAILVSACSDSNSPGDTSSAPTSLNSPAPVAPPSRLDSVLDTRLTDLAAVKAAIEKYKADKGSFPISSGWSGVGSKWGMDTADWVPGLVPNYLPSLPVDPKSASSQYLYWSDGKNYKIIAHEIDDCEAVRQLDRSMIDPSRDRDGRCWAYGYWTDGGVAK
ncbi:hypothetical protein ABGN05_29400 [Aquibium sp. LZ166]|uniref:Type II secretion system protein GspG C-terminal domain-containing protein n=1 Tax=Aquibium pacificus TaxID=3153579 RepID=A0ABV3SV45_9HYPH